MKLHTLCAVALALVVSACGRGEASEQGPVSNSLPARSSGLLQRVASQALATAHRGVRRYEAHVYVDGSDGFLSYVEDVTDRGDGCFSIVPRDVASNRVHPVLFRGLQIERQSFTRRYRDFRIRDLDAFLANYTVEDRGEVLEVAGRDCVVLHVEPRAGGSDRRVKLAIDPESALALGIWEAREDGTPISSLVYSEFELSPDLSDADCFSSQVDAERLADDLSATPDLSAEVGFEVWRPTLLPQGYEFLELSLLEDPLGDSWVKWTFTDGVDPLFFVQRRPDEQNEQLASSSALGLAGAELGDRVLVFEEQSISVVQGHLGDTEVIAAGRVETDDLLLLLEASRP